VRPGAFKAAIKRIGVSLGLKAALGWKPEMQAFSVEYRSHSESGYDFARERALLGDRLKLSSPWNFCLSLGLCPGI
jgi:hypothetical protein